jgi:hypothetical protein
MSHPQVADRADSLQIWIAAGNILNKQPQTADKGCVREGKRPVPDSCEHSDELSGSIKSWGVPSLVE